MRLLVIRHAVALPRGTPGNPDDDRPLTPRGVERFRKAARGLTRLVARPDALLTSPRLRARATADLAGRAWRRISPSSSRRICCVASTADERGPRDGAATDR